MVTRKKSKNDRRPERRPPSGTLGAAGKILVLLSLAVMAGAGWWLYTSRTQAPVSTPTAAFHPSVENTRSAPGEPPPGMVWIPGGEFSMGAAESPSMNMVGMQATTDSRSDSSRLRRWVLDGHDRGDQRSSSRTFVEATGYVTIAERTPRAEDFPGAPPENLVAGAVVFSPPDHPVPLDNHLQWWSYVKRANWRHPEGPESNITGREQYPVVQVAYDDAVAFATWAGKRLPTEAEWEFAARGGSERQAVPVGRRVHAGAVTRWPTPFRGTSRTRIRARMVTQASGRWRSSLPNGYGLYDVAGNVWEWTSDWYRPDYYAQLAAAGGVARNPRGPDTPFDPSEPSEKKRVHRGGSFLCTDQDRSRYMVGTRGKGEGSTGTNHVGFRLVKVP